MRSYTDITVISFHIGSCAILHWFTEDSKSITHILTYIMQMAFPLCLRMFKDKCNSDCNCDYL